MAGVFATRVWGGRPSKLRASSKRRLYEGKNSRRVSGGCLGLHDWARLEVSVSDSGLQQTIYLRVARKLLR